MDGPVRCCQDNLDDEPAKGFSGSAGAERDGADGIPPSDTGPGVLNWKPTDRSPGQCN